MSRVKVVLYHIAGGIVKHLMPMDKYEAMKAKIRARDFFDPERKKPYDSNRFRFGVNYYGHLKAQIGLGEGGRTYGRAISTMDNIPHAFFNVPLSNDIPQRENFYGLPLSKKPKYSINVINVNPENMIYFEAMFKPSSLNYRYNIACWAWEFEEIPETWIPYIDYFDEFWAISEHVAKAIRKATDKPVKVIHYGLSVDHEIVAFARDRFFDISGRTIFLSMFDSNSSSERKNVKGSIRAFHEAFSKDDESVALVLKCNNLSKDDAAMLKKLSEDSKNVFLLNEKMDHDGVLALIKSVDCFVSLHRAEGFGLVIAEAMEMGIPTIVTNYSANTDFNNESNSFLVDYSIIPGNVVYQGVKSFVWAEPDIRSAAEKMRFVRENPQIAKEIGENGRKFLLEHYSIKQSAIEMTERFNRIKGE